MKSDPNDTCDNKDGIDYELVGTKTREDELEKAKDRITDFQNVE